MFNANDPHYMRRLIPNQFPKGLLKKHPDLSLIPENISHPASSWGGTVISYKNRKLYSIDDTLNTYLHDKAITYESETNLYDSIHWYYKGLPNSFTLDEYVNSVKSLIDDPFISNKLNAAIATKNSPTYNISHILDVRFTLGPEYPKDHDYWFLYTLYAMNEYLHDSKGIEKYGDFFNKLRDDGDLEKFYSDFSLLKAYPHTPNLLTRFKDNTKTIFLNLAYNNKIEEFFFSLNQKELRALLSDNTLHNIRSSKRSVKTFYIVNNYLSKTDNYNVIMNSYVKMILNSVIKENAFAKNEYFIPLVFSIIGNLPATSIMVVKEIDKLKIILQWLEDNENDLNSKEILSLISAVLKPGSWICTKSEDNVNDFIISILEKNKAKSFVKILSSFLVEDTQFCPNKSQWEKALDDLESFEGLPSQMVINLIGIDERKNRVSSTFTDSIKSLLLGKGLS